MLVLLCCRRGFSVLGSRPIRSSISCMLHLGSMLASSQSAIRTLLIIPCLHSRRFRSFSIYISLLFCWSLMTWVWLFYCLSVCLQSTVFGQIILNPFSASSWQWKQMITFWAFEFKGQGQFCKKLLDLKNVFSRTLELNCDIFRLLWKIQFKPYFLYCTKWRRLMQEFLILKGLLGLGRGLYFRGTCHFYQFFVNKGLFWDCARVDFLGCRNYVFRLQKCPFFLANPALSQWSAHATFIFS